MEDKRKREELERIEKEKRERKKKRKREELERKKTEKRGRREEQRERIKEAQDMLDMSLHIEWLDWLSDNVTQEDD